MDIFTKISENIILYKIYPGPVDSDKFYIKFYLSKKKGKRKKALGMYLNHISKFGKSSLSKLSCNKSFPAF